MTVVELVSSRIVARRDDPSCTMLVPSQVSCDLLVSTAVIVAVVVEVEAAIVSDPLFIDLIVLPELAPIKVVRFALAI